MTLLEIKTTCAGYLGQPVADLTVLGQDLFLVAANQVRRQAEQGYDFEFNRQLVLLEVDGLVGGSLDETTIYGTNTLVEVGSVIDVGEFDESENLRPVEWTTVAEGLTRQRSDSPFASARYPTDAEFTGYPAGRARFEFLGNRVYRFPRSNDVTNTVFTIGLEIHALSTDWVASHLVTPTTDVWTTKGQQYLQWASIVHLNNLFKYFVPRTEGNLPPPIALAAEGLEQLKEWDTYRFERSRRHGR